MDWRILSEAEQEKAWVRSIIGIGVNNLPGFDNCFDISNGYPSFEYPLYRMTSEYQFGTFHVFFYTFSGELGR